MPVVISGTAGITNNATDLNYTGTLTGGTGVVNLGSGQFYKDASGNVGIGTSSITRAFANYNQLNINGSSGANIQMQYGGSLASNIAADSNALYLQNITAIVFGTGGTGTGTERARIDSSGQFLFRCTGLTNDAPNVSGGVLQQANGNSKIRVQSDGQAAFQFYSPTGGTSAPIGSVAVNATSVAYNTSSDYRLKENIQPMTGALAKVAQLKPVTYKWKVDGSDGEGFIAHELQEVCPDAVTGEKDGVDEAGNPKYQGIDTSFLVATLTAAIQELKAELDSVKAELATLKGAQA